MKKNTKKAAVVVVGLDLGDRQSQGCKLNDRAEILERFQVATNRRAMRECFAELPATTVVIEVGTHSPWVSRLLEELGHKVVVANISKVPALYNTNKKNDQRDAEFLARQCRSDAALLHPIKHRSEQTQTARLMLSSRNVLVESRTRLINHIRGAVKSLGERLPSCAAEAFVKKVRPQLPQLLRQALSPLLETLEKLNEQIRNYERQMEQKMREQYPLGERLLQVDGVGPLTTLAYMLTIEDPTRFAKSREVGPYLGLVPRQKSSGDKEPQLHITRAGDNYLRKLLVNAAHYILGPFGPDSEFRRFGEALFKRGGKNAKKRAVIAVARKLAVLLHRLWVGGATYDPFYRQNRVKSALLAGGCAPK